jgi:hypothetical protein
MGVSKKWLRIVRTKFLRSSNKDITLPPRTIVCTNQTQQQAIHGNESTITTTKDDFIILQPSTINSSSTTLFTMEDFAAIKIQAYFRGHLVCSIS